MENPLKPMDIKYKFKALKVYSSDEWMADNTKKYRQVFDRYETTYMGVELSFFNKLFDEDDWESNVTLKCFFVNGSQVRELCSLDQKRVISKTENVVYFRNSWGNNVHGSYWLRGNYLWEAYIDGVKAGETKFYVEDLGSNQTGQNPYFSLESIKLFEGDGYASGNQEKKYLSKFNQKEMRYVWGEVCFKNLTEKDYYAEMFFNFYDKAGLLKGSSPTLTYVAANSKDKVYTVYNGWGGETPGRWKSELYTLEIIFLDKLIATVPFQVGEMAVEGQAVVITDSNLILSPTLYSGLNPLIPVNLEVILNEGLAELNALTGLDNIKTEVSEMVQLVKFYQETGKDVHNKFSLHTVFTGNPGTGKTTVARILARIYKGLGILEKGHLVEVDREGLVAGFVGQTAIKTGEKITEAMGGVLFIDEAYSLSREHGAQHDFGGEAIASILKRMEDQRGKFGVIVAGYTDNMHEFIHSNPGLRSRFDKYFHFEDYKPIEMMTIAQSIFAKEALKLTSEALAHLDHYFHALFENRDKHFGNARSVRQAVGEWVKNQHLRLAAMKKEHRSPELLETVILEDVLELQVNGIKRDDRPRIGF